MTDLCREFGISRKTGYKLRDRYATNGSAGLYDQSRRPRHNPNRTPGTIAERVISIRQRYPTWGPKKLKQRLHDLEPEIKWPAASTIGAIIRDAGLVTGRKRRRRTPPSPAPRRESEAPNELWCMDFKGQFRMGNRSYCYPLTVSDHFSRFLLGCEALDSTKLVPAAQALETVFREHGLPDAMRSDNGTPFASTGRCGLTTLSVWLMRLHIRLERIEPGHPEQNGRHERMHRTLKAEATRPAGKNLLQQQERFDRFCAIYNHERPHEALDMKTPAVVHTKSPRPLPPKLDELTYPLHDTTARVHANGVIRRRGRKQTYVATSLVGQRLGLRQVDDGTWLVSFMELDLGYIDDETNRLIQINNQANPKVSPMSPV